MKFAQFNPVSGHPAPDHSAPNSPSTRLLQKDSQLIQIVDAALADATRRAGDHLVCRPGCTQCCYGAFAISALDALRLRQGMADLAETSPEKAAAITQRAQQFLAEFGPSFPGDPVTGLLGQSPDELDAFEDFANDAPCPVLDPETGLCDLYSARPMTCRVFGPPVRARAEERTGSDGEEGLAICELCFTQATPEEIAAAEMIVPYAEEQDTMEAMDRFDRSSPNGGTIIAYCLALSLPALPGALELS